MKNVYLTCGLVRYTEQSHAMQGIAFPTSVHFFPQLYRNAHMGLISPAQRLLDDVVDEATRKLQPESNKASNAQRALILAAGNTVFAGTQIRKRQAGSVLDYESRNRTLQTTQVQAGRVAQALAATGHISTDTSACASSMKALMDALHLIQQHGFESVGIVAVEDQVSLGILDFFGDMGICLSQAELEQGIRPSAFDSHNRGFLIAQGAALVWLETEASMRQSGRQPLARLLAAVTAGESCNNPWGQDPQGTGYESAIQWALRQAQRLPSSIDLVKTHGTGTVLNNLAEAAALRRVFADRLLATAYKPRIGHTFGASGLLESVLAITDARAGVVRGIANRSETDNVFLSHDQNHRIQHILALSAGMGNVYGAAIWEVIHPCTQTTY